MQASPSSHLPWAKCGRLNLLIKHHPLSGSRLGILRGNETSECGTGQKDFVAQRLRQQSGVHLP
jgi:hypothetical protein